MTTSYPAALDSYTNPTATDELDDEIGTRTHSEFHADNNDAIEAIQAELGTDPKGAAASVKARIAATETVANAALPSATAATTYQPLDSDLTTLAANITAFGHSLVDDANASAAQTTLGLVIGTNVQAYDGDLAAIAGLTSAADALPYFTGAGTASTTTLTAAARTVLDDATVGAMLTTMGGATAASPTFTGVASFAAGTAAAPSVTFTGDTNTGVYSDEADKLRFSTAGVCRMTIDASGKIGMGTAGPGAMFHQVASSASTIVLISKGAAGQTADIQQWQTDSAVVGSVDAAGAALFTGLTATGSAAGLLEALVVRNTNTGGTSSVGIRFDATTSGGGTPSNLAKIVAVKEDVYTTGVASTYDAGLRISVFNNAGWLEAISIATSGVTTFNQGLTIADAKNIVLNTTTGTKIGTATTQKLGFYNATPIVQGASVADATDAASAITQLNALISRIEALGLIATV